MLAYYSLRQDIEFICTGIPTRGTMLEMTPSPFHGIFSALGQDQDMKTVSGAPTTLSLEIEPEDDAGSSGSSQAAHVGQITVDIYEVDSYYVVRAPIAGVRLADLDIEVDGKKLTIRGQRTIPDDLPEDAYFVQECFWGEFSRSITLPTVIDPKKVKATFSKDSVLKILLPKEEKIKVVRISETG